MENELKIDDLAGWQRTHTAGELTSDNIGSDVTLMGWVHRRRDHGGVIFLDLRDRYGITQVVLDPAVDGSAHKSGDNLRNEWVIAIRGKVSQRPEGMENDLMPTGKVEVMVSHLKVLGTSGVPPFPINDSSDAGDSLRLRYRYLDIRRPELQSHLLERARFVSAFRRGLEEVQFVEVETPFLYKSTPEGAREFLVPSRTHPGQFYALPQSPQLFKQLLMVGGVDRYYQVVRCFRDEDLRADRQPEFTQIDCEMSFVERDDVLVTFEKVVRQAVAAFDHGDDARVKAPYPRMSYATAMADYGCDKPDLRFDLTLVDVTDLVQKTELRVFAEAVGTGGIVNAIRVPGGEDLSRKDLDALTDVARSHGAGGMAWAKKSAGDGPESWASPIAKFLKPEVIHAIEERLAVVPGDLLLFGAGSYDITKASLAAFRCRLGEMRGLIDEKELRFAWITDFPLFEKDNRTGRLKALHHPFTKPLPEDMAKLESDPLNVRAAAYDLVLNGNEVAGGSIRIHDAELQKKTFAALGLTDEEAQEKFGFLMEALSYGAPPHGGIAFGLDRLVMCLLGTDAIRDVIAFPKTQKGGCLMTGSPGKAEPEQLRDLHIRVQMLPGERP